MESGYNFLNQPQAASFNVKGKALHEISPGNPWRVKWALKVSKCSTGSLQPSYMSIDRTLNFGGSGTAMIF